MFNDCHNHITYTKTLFAADYTFDIFLQNKSKVVDNHIVFLNPIYKSLYNCNQNHKFQVIDLDDKKSIAFCCTTCKKVTYIGGDPYRQDNIKLLNDCDNKKKSSSLSLSFTFKQHNE